MSLLCRQSQFWRSPTWSITASANFSTLTGPRQYPRRPSRAAVPVSQQRRKVRRPRNMEKAPVYSRWSKDALIERIYSLEAERAAAQKKHAAEPEGEPSPTAAIAANTAMEAASQADDGGSNQKKRRVGPQKKKQGKKAGKIDPSKYSTRLVAFKLAYVGRAYGGFEFQAQLTLPTIEEHLWRAFVTSCLIFPEVPEEVRWEDPRWEYSKCGRTDRGVSAFGQVIAVRVRSNRPFPMTKEQHEAEDAAIAALPEEERAKAEAKKAARLNWDDFADEMDYCRILNRLLPPDIRILAWCPTTPEDFSARTHCRERQYRYFFTQPAYAPFPSSLEGEQAASYPVKDGWLDIDAMRAAAKKYEGYHDFRNLCKIDGSKQLTNFGRRIYESDIVEVPDADSAISFLSDPEFLPRPGQAGIGDSKSTTTNATKKSPKVYYFHVRGSAFLWHQIRCMVSVLFTVGQGLEEPAIVDRLLDIEKQPRRPNYVLASEYPLVLWDCIFPEREPQPQPSSEEDGVGIEDELNRGRFPKYVVNDEGGPSNTRSRSRSLSPSRTQTNLTTPSHKDSLPWVWIGDENPLDKHSAHGLVEHCWSLWRSHKLDEILSSQLLHLIASKGDIHNRLAEEKTKLIPPSRRVFEGADTPHNVGRYQPMSEKKLLYTAEEVNDREARRHGFPDGKSYREERHRRGKEKARLGIEARKRYELENSGRNALAAIAKLAAGASSSAGGDEGVAEAEAEGKEGEKVAMGG